MNRLSTAERARIIRALVEGNSIRSVSRMTGAARNTITSLLVQLGAACADYQDRTLRNLTSTRIECDEIWAFCYAKAKNVPEDKRDTFGYGDVWTWTAIDPDTKLVPSWLVGMRDGADAKAFIADLGSRLANRVQITTDGHAPYVEAIEAEFGRDVDYAMLIKQYGVERSEDASPTARRYSPNVVTGWNTRIVAGNPNADYISTSHVERHNLSMRMGMRRFTRLTNGFSKKVENHAAMVSLHFMHYNFARPHSALGKNITPAMAASVTDHVWTCDEIAGLVE
ncbi:MAG TPA: IS1 family transposase [Candidatus Limnocylindria bacterium]|nr:IS1 family transposase [Candidatus Limnocylindria bacterium]